MSNESKNMRDRILESEVSRIVVEVPGQDPLILRGVTLNDLDWLLRLPQQEMAPWEVTLALVEHQRMEATPPTAEVTNLSDEVMAGVLVLVTMEMGGEVAEDADLPSARDAFSQEASHRRQELEEIGKRFTQALEPTLRSVRRMSEVISATFGEVVRSINSHVEQLSRALEQVFDFRDPFKIDLPNMQRLFDSLPDMSVIRQALQETDDGRIALEEVGYGFNLEPLSLRFVREIGRADLTSRQIQNAVREFSRSDSFRADLEELFTSSSVLKRRWAVISIAIDAHHRREYALSIPALLPQLEGVITDLLIIKDEAVQQGSRVFKKKDGRIKLTRRGKRDELRGLHPKTSHVAPPPEAVAGADLILTEIAPSRNAILHGTRPSYPSAKLSVRLLLLLALYGQVTAAAERMSREDQRE